MTPAARIAAAIGILDAVIGGAPAEQTLTNWARRSRFAGSGDRAAVRDLVFDALRCRRSFGWRGGGDTGRGLMIGALRDRGEDPEGLFTGTGYAPPALTGAEIAWTPKPIPQAVALDVPDWLYADLEASLGDDTASILGRMRSRAEVFLRVNLRAATRGDAIEKLREDGIEAQPHALSPTALAVRTNARKIQRSRAFLDGWVEFQDAASQAVVDRLNAPEGASVLDFCAGGGGKALAVAARTDARVFAHDADPGRMRDIPNRAARAGVDITVIDGADLTAHGPYDLVLCDAPCSGSGAWRRSPEAKWRLNAQRLAELRALQRDILNAAAPLVKAGRVLAYATCSLLDAENFRQVQSFARENADFDLIDEHRLTPLDGGDGFYIAQMRRLTSRL